VIERFGRNGSNPEKSIGSSNPAILVQKDCEEFLRHVQRRKLLRSGPGNHHDVPVRSGNARLVEAKPFTNASFDAISAHGVPVTFLYDQPEAVVRKVVGREVHAEMGRANPAAGSLHSLVIIGGPELFVRPETTGAPQDASSP